jgi:hypothetical protein
MENYLKAIFKEPNPETPTRIYKSINFSKSADSICGISGRILLARAAENYCLIGKEAAKQAWKDAKDGNISFFEHIEYLFPSEDRVWVVGVLDKHWEMWWRPLDVDFKDRSRGGLRASKLTKLI